MGSNKSVNRGPGIPSGNSPPEVYHATPQELFLLILVLIGGVSFLLLMVGPDNVLPRF